MDEEELTMVSPMSRQEAPSFKAGRFTRYEIRDIKVVGE